MRFSPIVALSVAIWANTITALPHHPETSLVARGKPEHNPNHPATAPGLGDHFNNLPKELKEKVGEHLAASDGPGKHKGAIIANHIGAAPPQQMAITRGRLQHEAIQNQVNSAIKDPNHDLNWELKWPLASHMDQNRRLRRRDLD
ncbi:hypothetical protein H0H93_004806 [Arthromyces matolae]|nr:hypothetical protein H0H93_004806 [Arthromyces matolae]